MPTPLMLDPYVEAVARLMCQELALDPDAVVSIPDAAVTIDGHKRPVTMTGPQWMIFAVEKGEKLDEAQKRLAAQFVREVGRG